MELFFTLSQWTTNKKLFLQVHSFLEFNTCLRNLLVSFEKVINVAISITCSHEFIMDYRLQRSGLGDYSKKKLNFVKVIKEAKWKLKWQKYSAICKSFYGFPANHVLRPFVNLSHFVFSKTWEESSIIQIISCRYIYEF